MTVAVTVRERPCVDTMMSVTEWKNFVFLQDLVSIPKSSL